MYIHCSTNSLAIVEKSGKKTTVLGPRETGMMKSELEVKRREVLLVLDPPLEKKCF